MKDGQRACSFSCPGQDNNVYVQADNGWDPFNTVEAHASCGAQLAATCAGHGDCSGKGYGAYASASCTGSTTYDAGFTAACRADECTPGTRDYLPFIAVPICSGAVSTASITVDGAGVATGTVCQDGECAAVAPICIVGHGRACGLGVNVAELAVLYPDVLANLQGP